LSKTPAQSHRPVRVVFFGNAATNIAAIRYRVIKFAEMLEADGARCTVCLPSSLRAWQVLWEKGSPLRKALYLLLNILTRVAQLRHVPGADVVIFRGPLVYSGYGPPLLERLCRLLNRNLVYDIDDAVWVKADGVESIFQRFVDLDWLWKVAPLCRHGIVGNAYLQEEVKGRSPGTTVIPTCIDMQKHAQKRYPRRGEGDPVVLGWTGLYTNLVNLQPIEAVLQELAKKYPIKLLVATGRPYALEGVEVENHHWQADREIFYLQEPDIGLMPLLDTPSTRGKCAFKALQYMGVGTPCVISPVGMNAEIIAHGRDGFLASTPEEWRDCLEQLIVDATLREQLGRAARATIQQRYSHEACYPAMRGVVETVAGRSL
jgi:glycosyltransferase involved in cell wall biosynthesis